VVPFFGSLCRLLIIRDRSRPDLNLPATSKNTTMIGKQARAKSTTAMVAALGLGVLA
jgi:hypothetical protein